MMQEEDSFIVLSDCAQPWTSCLTGAHRCLSLRIEEDLGIAFGNNGRWVGELSLSYKWFSLVEKVSISSHGLSRGIFFPARATGKYCGDAWCGVELRSSLSITAFSFQAAHHIFQYIASTPNVAQKNRKYFTFSMLGVCEVSRSLIDIFQIAFMTASTLCSAIFRVCFLTRNFLFFSFSGPNTFILLSVRWICHQCQNFYKTSTHQCRVTNSAHPQVLLLDCKSAWS